MNKHKQIKVAYFPLFLVLYELVCYLSNDAYLPALPIISDNLSIHKDIAQLSLTVFFFGNALMQLIMGPIADRFGRRKVMLVGGGLFIISSFILGFAQTPSTLLIGRFFQGCSIAPMVVTGYATIHAIFEQKEAINTLAWMSSISVLAPAVGPLLGAIILLHFSWRYIFFILGFLGLIFLYAIAISMPETLKEQQPLNLSKIAKDYAHILGNWTFLQPTLCICLIFAIMIAWITEGPFLVLEVFHLTPMTFGYTQIIIFSALIIGTRCVPLLLERYSLTKMIFLCLTIITSACLLNVLLSYMAPDRLVDIVLPLALIAFSSGISFPVFNRLAIESRGGSVAIKMSLFASFIALSGFLGSLLITFFNEGSIVDFSHIILILGLLTLPLYIPWGNASDKP